MQLKNSPSIEKTPSPSGPRRFDPLLIAILGLHAFAIPATCETLVGHWANPVLASGEAVLGPLQDAAKLISKSTSDYSTLSGSVSTIDYKETHILTRGTGSSLLSVAGGFW